MLLSQSPGGHGSWVLFGAGGHARSIEDVLTRKGEMVVAVVGVPSGRPWDVPVIESEDEGLALVESGRHSPGVAVGDNAVRLRLIGDLKSKGAHLAPIISTTATLSSSATLGAGSVLLEHSHVGPGATLEHGVIANTGSVIEHDCTIAAGVHVGPGACILGGVTVGSGALIGSGARILIGVHVGAHARIGAGAVVNRDVPPGATAIGVPAVASGVDQS